MKTEPKAIAILTELVNDALIHDGFIRWDVSMKYLNKVKDATPNLPSLREKKI